MLACSRRRLVGRCAAGRGCGATATQRKEVMVVHEGALSGKKVRCHGGIRRRLSHCTTSLCGPAAGTSSCESY